MRSRLLDVRTSSEAGGWWSHLTSKASRSCPALRVKASFSYRGLHPSLAHRLLALSSSHSPHALCSATATGLAWNSPGLCTLHFPVPMACCLTCFRSVLEEPLPGKPSLFRTAASQHSPPYFEFLRDTNHRVKCSVFYGCLYFLLLPSPFCPAKHKLNWDRCCFPSA